MVALAESAASVDADDLVSPDADASPDAPVSTDTPAHPDAPAIPRPVSDAQLRANRTNSRKSTGPRTPAGKKRSSENALVHGLRAANILVPGEDAHELIEYRIAMIRSTNPRNPIEMEYVEQVIRAGWKLRRYQAAEVEALEYQTKVLHHQKRHEEANRPGFVLAYLLGGEPKNSALPRYEQQYTRMMSRAMDDLRKLKKDPIYGTLGDFAGEMIAAEMAQKEELEASETEAQEHAIDAADQNAPNEANPETTAVNHASSEAYVLPTPAELDRDLKTLEELSKREQKPPAARNSSG